MAGITGAAITIAVILLAPTVAKWNVTTVMAAITIAVTLCNGIISEALPRSYGTPHSVPPREAFC